MLDGKDLLIGHYPQISGSGTITMNDAAATQNEIINPIEENVCLELIYFKYVEPKQAIEQMLEQINVLWLLLQPTCFLSALLYSRPIVTQGIT